jgi:hypothetical protein
MEHISIYNIFIFFLIVSSNYLGELFPCRVQRMLSSNMWFKHIFGFLTLSFFVVLTDKSNVNTFKQIIYNSFTLYGIFLIFINTNVSFFIFSLFIAAITYLINIKINEINDTINNNNKEGIQDNIIQNNEQQQLLTKLNIINIILTYLFIASIGIGFFIYMGEKKIEYKTKFNYLTFIFGKAKCRGKSPSVSVVKALETAFYKK